MYLPHFVSQVFLWIQYSVIHNFEDIDSSILSTFVFPLFHWGQFTLLFFFDHAGACGILVPQPGIEPTTPALYAPLDLQGSPWGLFLSRLPFLIYLYQDAEGSHSCSDSPLGVHTWTWVEVHRNGGSPNVRTQHLVLPPWDPLPSVGPP